MITVVQEEPQKVQGREIHGEYLKIQTFSLLEEESVPQSLKAEDS